MGRFFTLLSRFYYGILLIFSFIGMGCNYFATRWGPALSDDSFYYIKPARDLLAGLPPTLSVHYPPLVPFAVAGIGLLGIEPLWGIRFLNLLCFGLNIFLAGWLVRKITRSTLAGIVASALFLGSQTMLEVHAWAMSEAFYFSLTLCSFAAFVQFSQQRTWRWLTLAGIFAGMAVITRYSGGALVIAGCLALLFFQRGKWTQRLKQTFLFGLLGSLPLVLYWLRNRLVTGEAVNVIRFHWIPLEGKPLIELCYNILLWFMPGRLARGREVLTLAALAAGILILLAVYWFVRRKEAQTVFRQAGESFPLVLIGLYALCNFVVLYVAHYLEGYKSPFDFRLLSPVHLGVLLFFVCWLALLGQQGGRILRIVLVLLALGMSGLYASRMVETTAYYGEHGMGFAGRYWHDSEAIEFIKQHPNTPMISSAPYAVYFWAGQKTEVVDAYSPEQMRQFLKQNRGYLVVFDSMPLEMYTIDPKEYLAGLEKAFEFSNCTIYQINPSS